MKSPISWFELCAACHCVKISACFRVRAGVLPNIRNATLGRPSLSLSEWKSEVAFHGKDLKGLVLCPKCPYLSNNNFLSFSHLLLSRICSLALLYSQLFLYSAHLHHLVRQTPTHLLDIWKACYSHVMP